MPIYSLLRARSIGGVRSAQRTMACYHGKERTFCCFAAQLVYRTLGYQLPTWHSGFNLKYLRSLVRVAGFLLTRRLRSQNQKSESESAPCRRRARARARARPVRRPLAAGSRLGPGRWLFFSYIILRSLILDLNPPSPSQVRLRQANNLTISDKRQPACSACFVFLYTLHCG